MPAATTHDDINPYHIGTARIKYIYRNTIGHDNALGTLNIKTLQVPDSRLYCPVQHHFFLEKL